MNFTSLLAGKHLACHFWQRWQPIGKERAEVEICPDEDADSCEEENRRKDRLDGKRQAEDLLPLIPLIAGSLSLCRGHGYPEQVSGSNQRDPSRGSQDHADQLDYKNTFHRWILPAARLQDLYDRVHLDL